MLQISVPWQRWIDEGETELTFPESWQVSVAAPRDAADIGDAGIARAFAAPLGSPRLPELARGRRSAAIAVDDITRPTPTYRVLPNSPNLSGYEVRRHFPESIPLYQRWEDVLSELECRHGPGSRVTVYPCATLQLNPDNRTPAAEKARTHRSSSQGDRP